MKKLEIRRDPEEVGLDPLRLQRIQTHLDRYVALGQFSGWLTTVARGGDLVWVGRGGYRDRERSLAVTDDTIWRLYSMTKPITAVAVMMLYEEGVFDLNDPVGRWIEELRDPLVYVSGTAANPITVPATEPVRVHHLLSHTSGLTYGFQNLTTCQTLMACRCPKPSTTGARHHCSSNQAARGTTQSRPMFSVVSSKSGPARASTTSYSDESSIPWG